MENNNITLTGIFKEIEERSFKPDKCFLCGATLTQENKTVEHVIPRWAQRKYNLWDQNISLLNGSHFPYRQLTIPCCFTCNNQYLSPFENRIRAATEAGYDTFIQLDQETIFLWIGKIYFGLMYRELFLDTDRRKPEEGTITDPEYLLSFYSLFLFLQGIRGRHKFVDFFPASVFTFRTQIPADNSKQWDFVDIHGRPFIAIRMGEIGVIVCLEDGGATKSLEDALEKHKEIALHPLQFRELIAKILYKLSLVNRIPKYMNVQHADKEIVETYMMPLQGLSDLPIFNDWNNDEYSKILSAITYIPIETCQPKKGLVYTWLYDANGNSNYMDIKEFPS